MSVISCLIGSWSQLPIPSPWRKWFFVLDSKVFLNCPPWCLWASFLAFWNAKNNAFIVGTGFKPAPEPPWSKRGIRGTKLIINSWLWPKSNYLLYCIDKVTLYVLLFFISLPKHSSFRINLMVQCLVIGWMVSLSLSLFLSPLFFCQNWDLFVRQWRSTHSLQFLQKTNSLPSKKM